VSNLAFLSPDEARPEGGFAPLARSPLERALAGAEGIRDLSLLGKLELRGSTGGLDVEGDVITIEPHRALVVCATERCTELRRTLPGVVIDLTGALAGIEIEGDVLMRRLTDLDLARLPAVGKLAGVPALVSRHDTRFHIFFPQEYGDSVVGVVRDLMEGL